MDWAQKLSDPSRRRTSSRDGPSRATLGLPSRRRCVDSHTGGALSAAVDRERREDTREVRFGRTIAMLEELLVVVKAWRDELPGPVVAASIGRTARTVRRRRREVEQVVRLLGGKGQRRSG